MQRPFQVTLLAAAIAMLIPAVSNESVNAQTQPRSSKTADLSRLDDDTTGGIVRASELIGFNIQNPQGESLGKVHDLAVDAKSGKIRYLAVTYGGFLGLGSKLFAVPYEAFQVHVHPDSRDKTDRDASDYLLVLDVNQQQLEGQEGFDDDRWPNMADRTWAASLDKRYGVQRDDQGTNRLREAQRNRQPQRGTQR